MNQDVEWTQFEEFPRFMEGVESVSQLDDRHLHWVAEIGGVRREWDAEVAEQHPDERVAWRATDGTDNAGVVTFHRIDDGTTRVIVETVGDAMGFVRRRVAGDLGRFKEFIETQQRETGAWRGDIDGSS